MVKCIAAGQRANQKMSFRPHEISDVSLEEKVVFLGSPATYPELTVPLDMKETHMSYVFLAGDTVLKLKKPVKYPFLDFSTIAAREFNCREEIIPGPRRPERGQGLSRPGRRTGCGESGQPAPRK